MFERDTLHFIPLSGIGHFGANLNVYIYNDEILIVDLGIGFPSKDDKHYIDAYLPDISFLKKHKDKIVGLVITHAHEDHVGAIPHLWPELKCPIYATPFASVFIRNKVKEYRSCYAMDLNEIELSSKLNLGSFACELFNVNHSILEPVALSIKLPKLDPIFHTGDWTFDPDPVIRHETDIKKQEALSKQGVLAIIGDSTNALRSGHSVSEEDVFKTLVAVFAKQEQKIIVTCFSSNVERWHSIARAAERNGRSVALVGRSLWNIYECARSAGYLKNCPKFLNTEQAKLLSSDQVVYICTGTQGEEYSTLNRVSLGKHPEVKLQSGDTVIFSSFNIPGNEVEITKMKERFLKKKAYIIDQIDYSTIHASGHPNQDELLALYKRLKPQIVIPVHGELPMLYGHGKIAKKAEVPQSYIPRNGDVIAFKNNRAVKVDKIEVSHQVYTDYMIVDHNAPHLVNKSRLSVAGICVVSFVVDDNLKLVMKPQISTMGIIDGFENESILYKQMSDYVADHFVKTKDIKILEEEMRFVVRRFFSKILRRKKPMTKVLIHQLGEV